MIPGGILEIISIAPEGGVLTLDLKFMGVSGKKYKAVFIPDDK